MPYKTERNRVVYTEDGRKLAEVTFPDVADGVVDIDRTFVDDALRGRGVAAELMERVAAALREDGRSATASCSYARGWFEKHSEYSDILV
ncbi:MAG: N-acetyltransferase [Oscillospiraceae bacterium]|jgi:predicted GNAT family acetyltransferase|nr:N-acetyltransferase [Oscillospiraceae bacterium]